MLLLIVTGSRHRENELLRKGFSKKTVFQETLSSEVIRKVRLRASLDSDRMYYKVLMKINQLCST